MVFITLIFGTVFAYVLKIEKKITEKIKIIFHLITFAPLILIKDYLMKVGYTRTSLIINNSTDCFAQRLK